MNYLQQLFIIAMQYLVLLHPHCLVNLDWSLLVVEPA